MKPFFTTSLACLLMVGAGLAVAPAGAQQPIRHELIRSDLPPGMAASYYQLSHPDLVGVVQPVQLIAPEGCHIGVARPSGFESTGRNPVSVGLHLGAVYRFELDQLPLPGAEDRKLYPSVEVIQRLYPPAGLEHQFPIQVQVTRDDLRHALEGRLVTRVIYLEDPHGSMPHKHVPGLQPSFDVGGGEDPLRAAEQLGRPVAILRMGSRVPLAGETAVEFNFGAQGPQLLPDPQSIPAVESFPADDSTPPSSARALPPIQRAASASHQVEGRVGSDLGRSP